MCIVLYNFSVYIIIVYINLMLLSRHMRSVSKIFIMWNAMRSTQLHMQYRRHTKKQRYSTISNYLFSASKVLSPSYLGQGVHPLLYPKNTIVANYQWWTRHMGCTPTHIYQLLDDNRSLFQLWMIHIQSCSKKDLLSIFHLI